MAAGICEGEERRGEGRGRSVLTDLLSLRGSDLLYGQARLGPSTGESARRCKKKKSPKL